MFACCWKQTVPMIKPIHGMPISYLSAVVYVHTSYLLLAIFFVHQKNFFEEEKNSKRNRLHPGLEIGWGGG